MREREREIERERERDLRQQIHQVFDEVPLSKQEITPQSLCGFVGELSNVNYIHDSCQIVKRQPTSTTQLLIV